MFGSRVVAPFVLLLAAVLVFPNHADAQVERLRRAAQREIEKQARKMIGDAIACSFDDTACVEQAKKDGEKVVIVDGDGEIITDENGNPITDPEQAKSRVQEPGEGCGGTTTSPPVLLCGRLPTSLRNQWVGSPQASWNSSAATWKSWRLTEHGCWR